MSRVAAPWLGCQKKTLRASEQRRPDVAAERDDFSKEIAAGDPNRLVFLDESGILTNMTRRTARAPIGERACGEAPVNWKRLTVLGALGLDGVVTMTTVTTGTTIPVFLGFLQTTLLPVLREQKPDAVVVMDNLSAHKNQAVKDAIAAAGLTLRYLPRYSPDFSPIEPCWSKIKTALRAVAARTVESLRAALDTVVADVTADDAAGWFGHCGYVSAS
ncbi:MAG TPA: IS630 family transposase [Blastocatellia bacterium]|nr:IS630 family transposase [Blastocatellia bacterium]